MSSSPSVTAWIGRAKAGDPEAARKLLEHYFERLVRLARANLPRGRRKHGDHEEDVALSALDSFLRAAKSGRFPDLNNRDNLWSLLATITMRKAWKVGRREKRIPEVGESALAAKNDNSQGRNVWEPFLSREPTPEFAAEMTEQCRKLLDRLRKEDRNLESVARWKLEGHTNAEIAAKIGRVVETVERKLARIRKIWKNEEPAP
jgi:DNA-directed RNA polymerase specialized sigma24 family protein